MDSKRRYERELREAFRAIYLGEEKLFVFGQGPEKPDIMLIGEAPGEQETLQGKPFVGKAGKNLDAFLRLLDMPRDRVYITNAVKFRPVKRSEKTGKVINRPPTVEEMTLFIPWLMREIELVRPRTLVTLGACPLRALRGKGQTIGQVHGAWHTLTDPPIEHYALYHPASIIYNPSLRPVYEEDLARLKKTLPDHL